MPQTAGSAVWESGGAGGYAPCTRSHTTTIQKPNEIIDLFLLSVSSVNVG